MEFSDAEVADAFVYVMSRYLVNRQEQIDLGEADIGYNVVKYNPVGSADFVNPNLDVAYLEAWAAVDVDTPAILTIPRIDDRYYTAQLIDGARSSSTSTNEPSPTIRTARSHSSHQAPPQRSPAMRW